MILHQAQSKLTAAEAHKLIKNSIRFNLPEFQTGDFAEIETRPWILLLNPDAPQGVIQVNSTGVNIGIDKHNFLLKWYQAAWNKVKEQAEEQQKRREQLSRAMRSAGVSTAKDI